MHSNLLQGLLRLPRRKKNIAGQFDEGRTETDRIARRTSEAKDKMNNDKGTNLKDLSVTDQIMNAYRK